MQPAPVWPHGGAGISAPVDRSGRRVALATLGWLLVLSFVFIGLTGEWTSADWVGAGGAGIIAAVATVPLTRSGMFRLEGRWRWVRYLPAVILQVFVDFWTVTVFLVRALVSRQRGQGVFVARSDFPTGGKEPEPTTWRGFVGWAATLSPNSYVVDIDAETGNRLSHDLIPRRASERPA